MDQNIWKPEKLLGIPVLQEQGEDGKDYVKIELADFSVVILQAIAAYDYWKESYWKQFLILEILERIELLDESSDSDFILGSFNYCEAQRLGKSYYEYQIIKNNI